MLGSPLDRSFASIVLGWNRHRETPCSSLGPPSNIFSSHNLQNQPLNCPGSPEPATIFWVYLLIIIKHELLDSSELFHQDGGHINHLVNMHLGLPIPTSVWASILSMTMWLWSMWATFGGNWSRRSARAQSILKMQSQNGSCALFLDMQKPSQDEWVKPRMLWKLPFS